MELDPMSSFELQCLVARFKQKRSSCKLMNFFVNPLVHLTLGQLFGRLNRWQKKVNQSAEIIL